jgi:hypothetical protein
MGIIATIDLVAGDSLPSIALTLTNQTNGQPIDVSGATTVNVLFRQAGTANGTPVPCTTVSGGADGRIQFALPSTVTSVTPGTYEGSIVIQFNNSQVGQQTVYDVLKFRIRAA